MAITYRTSAAGGGTSGTGNRTVTITPAVGDLFVVFVSLSANVANPSSITMTDNNGNGGLRAHQHRQLGHRRCQRHGRVRARHADGQHDQHGDYVPERVEHRRRARRRRLRWFGSGWALGDPLLRQTDEPGGVDYAGSGPEPGGVDRQGDDYPVRLRVGRGVGSSVLSSLFTGATVTLTINGTALSGTVTDAAGGLLTFTPTSAVYNLAAGSYTLLLRMVDSGGFTRTLATSGTGWRVT